MSKGTKRLVKALLFAGASLNAHGGEALRKAATRGDADIVQMLLDARARVGVERSYELSPLGLAIKEGRLETVKVLLAARAVPKVQDADRTTALMLAAKSGDVDIIQLILSQTPSLQTPNEAELDFRDRLGDTALIKAVCKDCPGAVKMLLDAGASWDPLHAREINTFQLLCRGNFSQHYIDVVGERNRSTFYVQNETDYAARDCVDVIKLLIAAKAEVNSRPGISQAPLFLAARRPHVLATLLRAGALIDARGVNGQTALIAAVRSNSRKSVEVLLESKADVNIMDSNNGTALKYALIHALKSENIFILWLLVAAGAQAELGYSADVSPLDRALSSNRPDIVRVLLDAKADVKKLLEHGMLPLETAIRKNMVGCVRHLVAAGLDLSQCKDPSLTIDLLNITVKKNDSCMLGP